MRIRRVLQLELVLVAYDSPHNRRRRRIARVLNDFGERWQYSVFECWIAPDDRARITRRIHREVDVKFDRVAVVPVPQEAVVSANHLGLSTWRRPPPFWIIGRFETEADQS